MKAREKTLRDQIMGAVELVILKDEHIHMVARIKSLYPPFLAGALIATQTAILAPRWAAVPAHPITKTRMTLQLTLEAMKISPIWRPA